MGHQKGTTYPNLLFENMHVHLCSRFDTKRLWVWALLIVVQGPFELNNEHCAFRHGQ